MSSDKLYRNPAWTSLAPGLPDEAPADDALARQIGAVLGSEGVLHALQYGGRPSGHFRFDALDGRRTFLKLVPEERCRTLRQADAVADWLGRRGVAAIGPVRGFPRRLASGQWLFAYPYHDGRRFAAEADDVRRLGEALARLHRALADHPQRAAWDRATRRRLAGLQELRGRLASGRLSAGPCPDELAALAADAELDFVRPDLPRTPLHGDLNAGNVLCDRATGRPVLLDFEDVFHSVLPPLFELALAAQRFVLVPVAGRRPGEALVAQLLHAYEAALGRDAGVCPADLPAAMRSLSLRSLCVLADCQQRGIAIDESEWRKFFYLAALARPAPGRGPLPRCEANSQASGRG